MACLPPLFTLVAAVTVLLAGCATVDADASARSSTPLAASGGSATPHDASAPLDENEGPPGRPLSAAERKAIDDRAAAYAAPIAIDSDGRRTLPDDEGERKRLIAQLGPEEARKLEAVELDRSGARLTHVGIALLVGAPFLGLLTWGPLSLAGNPSTETVLGVTLGTAVVSGAAGTVLVVKGGDRRQQARTLWPGISLAPRRHGGVTTGAVAALTWSF